MNVFYGKIQVQDGNYISKQQASTLPKIILDVKPKKFYTVLLTDPDAVGGNKIHYWLVNYSLHNQGTLLLPYVGPNPPKGSGVHRYYFLLIQQESFIEPKVNFSSRYISIENIFNLLDISNNQMIVQKYFTCHA